MIAVEGTQSSENSKLREHIGWKAWNYNIGQSHDPSYKFHWLLMKQKYFHLFWFFNSLQTWKKPSPTE